MGVPSMPEFPFVSVVVVNYNGRHYLGDCLASLAHQTYPVGRRAVILVDNGSTDGSVGFVQELFPWVRLIAAGKNLGFAGGNNLGILQARGERIALLNNDAVADPRWLAALVEALGEETQVGGIASKVLFRDDPGR